MATKTGVVVVVEVGVVMNELAAIVVDVGVVFVPFAGAVVVLLYELVYKT